MIEGSIVPRINRIARINHDKRTGFPPGLPGRGTRRKSWCRGGPALHRLPERSSRAEASWLAGLDLGEDWLRAVCWDNPVAMFGLPEAVGGG